MNIWNFTSYDWGTFHCLHHWWFLGRLFPFTGCPGLIKTVIRVALRFINTNKFPKNRRIGLRFFMWNKKYRKIVYRNPMQMNRHSVNPKSGPIVIQGLPFLSKYIAYPFPNLILAYNILTRIFHSINIPDTFLSSY